MKKKVIKDVNSDLQKTDMLILLLNFFYKTVILLFVSRFNHMFGDCWLQVGAWIRPLLFIALLFGVWLNKLLSSSGHFHRESYHTRLRHFRKQGGTTPSEHFSKLLWHQIMFKKGQVSKWNWRVRYKLSLDNFIIKISKSLNFFLWLGNKYVGSFYQNRNTDFQKRFFFYLLIPQIWPFLVTQWTFWLT